MTEQIVDARGTGHGMQVDDHGRAHVLANTVSHPAHHASYHKDFFYSYHQTSVPGGSVETPSALVQGANSSIELEVYAVIITCDKAAVISVYFDALYASGGTAVTPTNSNRTSNKTLDAMFYTGGGGADLVVDTAVQDQVTAFEVAAGQPFIYPIDGTVILGLDTSLLFSVTAAEVTTARVTLGLTKHVAGVQL